MWYDFISMSEIMCLCLMDWLLFLLPLCIPPPPLSLIFQHYFPNRIHECSYSMRWKHVQLFFVGAFDNEKKNSSSVMGIDMPVKWLIKIGLNYLNYMGTLYFIHAENA